MSTSSLIISTFDKIARRKSEEQPQGCDFWRCGSAQVEALALFKMVRCGGTSVEAARELIGVNEEQRQELEEWAVIRPSLRGRIENMIQFRSKVLSEFDRLVEQHKSVSALAAD
jgi:hypothetical protein